MPSSDSAAQLESLLLAVQDQLGPGAARRDAPPAVAGLDWTVLTVLSGRGPFTLPDLFAALRRTAAPADVVECLNRLGDLGWLVAGPQGDRRVEVIGLTPEGLEGHAAAVAWRRALRERALAGLTDAERAAFLAALERIRANLVASDRPV